MNEEMEEQAIHVWLGNLPVSIPSRLIRAALFSQVPAWVSGKGPMDARTGAFRLGVKAAAKAALSFMEWQLVKAGSLYPLPDHDAVKKDALGYAVHYFLDLILYGLCGQEWDALYVEAANGQLVITGLAPATFEAGDEPAAIPGADADRAGPDGPREETPGESGPSGDGGRTLVYRGDIGEREDDLREAVSASAPDPVA